MNSKLVGPLIVVVGLCIMIVGLFLGLVRNEEALACKMKARQAEQRVEQHTARTEYLRGRMNMLEQLDSLGMVPAETKRIFQSQLAAEKGVYDQITKQQAKMSLVRDLDCEK